MSLNDITPREWEQMNEKLSKGFSPDPVHQPTHYKQGRIEAIEIIRQALNGAKTLVSGQSLYLWGNVIKYILRWPHKNKVEDLRKARVYLDWLIKEESGVE